MERDPGQRPATKPAFRPPALPEIVVPAPIVRPSPRLRVLEFFRRELQR